MRGLLRYLERFTIFNGGYFRIMQDPYHKEAGVGILTWIVREVDEILHGEVLA